MAQKIIWTIEKIKSGFEKFFETNGRYPTALEVDDFIFLPSSRQIQRKFGGLPNLRKALRLPIENYTMGESRSNTACNINKKGKNYENIIFELLKNNFEEKFIHIEKPVIYRNNENYSSKDRYDFYVYAKPINFAIDVFGTDGDIRSFIRILNIKERKYKKLSNKEILYFVYFGKDVDTHKILRWLVNKKNKLPENWKLISADKFKIEILKYKSFRAI